MRTFEEIIVCYCIT